jgi:phosphotransferase system HPr (HPr) family protein
MDLGSAVMSAELAIELADLGGAEVRLSPAPLVEGLVAAVVRAAGGADLATVAREAEAALKPKQAALGEPVAAGPSGEDGSAEPSDLSVTLTLINPTGLHARPAAQLATALGLLDATVVVAANGREADGASSLELLTLGTETGSEITVSASGPDAQRAVDTARALVEEGFGELDVETT